MDTTYPTGVATLVGLADGTTSLYTSTGGGIIGGGAHAEVASVTERLLTEAEDNLDKLTTDSGTDLPAPGRVIIRVLTFNGRLSVDAAEDDLGHGRHPAAPLFHAAHRVITALRLIDEAGRPGNA
jgi:hypothetical protein